MNPLLYRTLIRPVLFGRESEAIHDFTLKTLRRLARNATACELVESVCRPADLPIEVWGLRFPNPLGVAAGMDKQAAAVPAWHALGFGFTELGGVTRHPQEGNPRPRMFRAIKDRALVNRMGFNNPGAEAVALNLAAWRAVGRWPPQPIGINLGKSKVTPLAQAPDDYAQSFRILRPYADFFVVNVSSPNTPGLRQLQDKSALDEILAALQGVNADGSAAKPILVKVAPDLKFDALDQILELVVPRRVAGLVATNTTIARPETGDPQLAAVYAEQGGLSGLPLRERSTAIIRHLHRQTAGTLPIIGVGGIFDAADAWQKIAAGACLLQVYTGLVYEGPGLARAIVSGLRSRLVQRGYQNLRDAVGCENMIL